MSASAMNKDEVRKLLLQGKKDEVAQWFREQGYSLDSRAILQDFANLSPATIYDLFLKAAALTASDDSSENLQDTRTLREHLKTFIPNEIVVSVDALTVGVPKYLQDCEDCAQLFKNLWESLRCIRRDDLTIGVALRTAFEFHV